MKRTVGEIKREMAKRDWFSKCLEYKICPCCGHDLRDYDEILKKEQKQYHTTTNSFWCEECDNFYPKHGGGYSDFSHLMMEVIEVIPKKRREVHIRGPTDLRDDWPHAMPMLGGA